MAIRSERIDAPKRADGPLATNGWAEAYRLAA
jgi:hypothetical protein